ncbi:ctg1 protein [Agaricus bisporus var. bisporus H97]|uniref:ctg1 protein n=1 Tax=Agaricus bisporus var. bisporus (strain H97 / ATCC MYA-4626 / FGSC 10389) TaxID=936046 RepID=UPI00029F7AA9|nr:ctg1 protein [Agaricus bisporus var. bisporus H97]EKV49642.1 ctg1 protein [Agaricus bisporus var. bisporus H97]
MSIALHARTALRTTSRAAAMASSRFLRHNSGRGASSTMHDNNPELLDLEKHRNLTNSQHKTSTPHQKEAPGWNEYLASQSEANVKADRSSAPLKDLQAETVKYVKARHFDTEASESNTTAYYTHDVVSGPLSGAEGKEEVHVHEEAQLAKKVQPTESEEDVKADRGEI